MSVAAIHRSISMPPSTSTIPSIPSFVPFNPERSGNGAMWTKSSCRERSRDETRDLAGLAAEGMARHLRHAAYVDANCRKNPLGPEPTHQPLVANCPLRRASRPEHLADPLRNPRIRNDLR